MSIFFDFSEVYKDEYKKRIMGSSFYKYLDEINMSLEYFIKEEFVKENTFFIACSSLERRMLKDINFDYYKNFFIRVKGKKYHLLGDFIINHDNESYYKVKDIYMNDSLEMKKYEKEFSFEVRLSNEYKKSLSDIKLIREIINSTPNIYDYKCLDFVRDFDSYLEFERKHFSKKLGFYKTNEFRTVELKEIKRSMETNKKYEDSLYFDDGNNYIYVDYDAITSEPFNKVIAVEFIVSINKSEGAFSDLQYFVSQEIELANELDALENDKLKNDGNELEFSFKTKRMGSLLKPLEKISEDSDSVTFSFSKFWSDEDSDLSYSFARVSDYITSAFGERPLLVNIASGDVALYKRGKQALKDLKEGNLKNPGIASYLFNISEYETSENIINKEDIEWSNNSLDKYQKEAVYKAINSNSIFLLQGPPGTGKTQTITEMVYQFNKMGKKVLLSSQTHVAIDNVIERLPDELDVLPIRLINSERKMKANKNYLPDKLVDNFYEKIKNKYENKEENFKAFSSKLDNAFKEEERISELINKNASSRKELKSINNNFYSLKAKCNEIDNKISFLINKINEFNKTIFFINEFKRNNYIFKDYSVNISLNLKDFDLLINKYKIEELSNFNEYLKYFSINYSDNKNFINDYNEMINKNINYINNYYKEVKDNLIFNTNELNNFKMQRSEFSKSINDLVKEKEILLKSKGKEFREIDEYFDYYFNNKIVMNKRPISDEDCLKEINNYLVSEKEKFEVDKNNYSEYKDIYDSVINYISENKDELLERDRVKYTKSLLNNNANVYSITCNANSKYLEEKNDYLKKLGLGNIELKNIDFDVVIIDEVSKANSIELLIPILYGKSIILVGDHRQLPPLFKYKEKMFSDSDDKVLLNKYEALVENSMFKELFKKARKNKYMLVNQYRSHEQIMNIVNIFYDDKLRLGYGNEQNEAKRHFLNVSSNNYSLFEENIHTYWFNSHYDINSNVSYEKKKKRGSIVSTSFYNEEEIFLTKNILKKLDEEYEKLINDGVIKEPFSVGVISLYKDQVSELKKEINKMKFNYIDFNKNKISTVDEFQGKEEDIIIVNFVRNNKSFETGDFTKKYERINVALSRARKMLIIVGSKPFFTSLKVDLENMDDSSEVNTRRIYKEIYDRVVGKVDAPNLYFKDGEINEN